MSLGVSDKWALVPKLSSTSFTAEEALLEMARFMHLQHTLSNLFLASFSKIQICIKLPATWSFCYRFCTHRVWSRCVFVDDLSGGFAAWTILSKCHSCMPAQMNGWSDVSAASLCLWMSACTHHTQKQLHLNKNGSKLFILFKVKLGTCVAVHVHFKISFLAKFLQAHMASIVFSCLYLIHLEKNQEKNSICFNY